MTNAMIRIAKCITAALLACVFVNNITAQEKRPAWLTDEKRTFSFKQKTDKRQSSKGDLDRGSKLNEITYVVRMPSSWTPEKEEEALSKGVSSVRGILVICTWDTDEFQLKGIFSRTGYFSYLVNFADQNNVALVSWSSFGGYQNGTSTDEMSKAEMKKQDAVFNDRLSEWEKGYKRFLKKYNLPAEPAMMYGVSAGANIAHRVAMRKPQYFSGVCIHINSSYDIPTPNGKKLLWLVSTGELEYGYAAAQRFYQKMIDMQYCTIFKAFENKGHDITRESLELAAEFFKYLITFMPDPSDPEWAPPPVDKFYMMQYPQYVGDYLNQVAYPYEKAKENIPTPRFMVALPTTALAKTWGMIIE